MTQGGNKGFGKDDPLFIRGILSKGTTFFKIKKQGVRLSKGTKFKGMFKGTGNTTVYEEEPSTTRIQRSSTTFPVCCHRCARTNWRSAAGCQ